MGRFTIPLEIAAVLALILVAVTVYLGARRVWLSRPRGSFDLAVRRPGHRWMVGVAQYQSRQIDWYRVFHLSLRPAAVFERRRFVIVGRRSPGGTERAMLADLVIVQCRYEGEDLEFAMSEQAYFGLSSWTEAAPPGAAYRTG